MTYDDFVKEFEPLGNRCDADGDVYFVTFFSKEQNAYNAFWQERMDFGDALLIIEGLIKKFNLSAEAVAAMQKENGEK